MYRSINRIFHSAAVVVILASCSSESSEGSGVPDNGYGAETFADSISAAYGEVVGAQLNISFASLPPEKKLVIDRDAFMAGLRNALMLNASDRGQIEGLWRGTELAEQLDYYDAVGVRLDRDKVAEEYGKALAEETVDAAAYDAAQADYDRMMTSVQHLILEKMRADRRQQMMLAQQMRNANIEAARNFVEKLQREDKTVTATESGLFYKVLRQGQGDSPVSGSTVEVDYTVSTIDGHIVDSSRGSAVPVEIGGSTIAGLQEGLPLMKQGAKYRFYVPSHLGFVRSTPGVEPGQMLVIDVELVKI